MLQGCAFDALALTVDTIAGGKRERCLRTGFTSPPRAMPRSALSFASHPAWTLHHLLGGKFELPNLAGHARSTEDPGRDNLRWRKGCAPQG